MVVLTNFPPPTEGIKLEQPLTSVFVDSRELGKGTLYIAESRLSWVNSQTKQGFSIEYPHIVVHGICKDRREFPHECLLLTLDTCLEDDKGSESGDESHSDGAGSVFHFVPDDKGVLDAMYKAMVFCQELHPDPQESFSDDDLCEDAESEGEETIGNGHSHNGNERQNGVRTGDEEGEAMDVEEDGQFEDAD